MAFIAIFCVVALVGYFVGYIIGRATGLSDVRIAAVAADHLKRAMSKVGDVPNFIPPGERAETVEPDLLAIAAQHDADHVVDLTQRKCQGCRYQGRYVLAKEDR